MIGMAVIGVIGRVDGNALGGKGEASGLDDDGLDSISTIQLDFKTP